MDYNKIVSVTGLGGLFELLSSKSDGAVVRSLDDKSTKFVSSRQHNFSHLESIEVFCTKENVSLAQLFIAMKNSEEKVPDPAADIKLLKDYFQKILPDMDFERVYASDMKKMIKWYGVLQKNDIEIKMRSDEEGEEQPDNSKQSRPAHNESANVKDMKPKKTTARKIESRGVK